MTASVLTPRSLALLTVAAIVSLRNLALIAPYGLNALYFYGLAGLGFFVPTALVCAELGARVPQAGGVYAWVRAAFGPPVAFVIHWAAWCISLVWYPTALAFAAAALCHLWEPAWAQNPLIVWSFMMTLLWSATALALRGVAVSAHWSNSALIVGTLIPGLLMIGLAAFWAAWQPASQWHWGHFEAPWSWEWRHYVLLSGVVLGLGGVEVAGFHTHRLADPQNDFPQTMLRAAALVLGFSMAGTLAIALVVPAHDLNLMTGTLQVFSIFFAQLHMAWLAKVFVAMIVIGILASLTAWIISPAQGLLAAEHDGILPRALGATNASGAPHRLLLLQSGIATVLSVLYGLLPDVESAYWILTAMMAQLSCILYVGLYLALWRLRRLDPQPARFHIGGGSLGFFTVMVLGVGTSLVVYLIDLVPPQSLHTLSGTGYTMTMALGPWVFLLPAFSWAKTHVRNTKLGAPELSR